MRADHIQKMYEKFPKKRQTIDRYFRFIEAFSLPETIPHHTANHHILPKAIFPEYSNLFEFPENRVILSDRAHYLAHWILGRISITQLTAFEILSVNHKGERISGSLYAQSRSRMSKYLSDLKRGSSFYNNGEKCILVLRNQTPPEGFNNKGFIYKNGKKQSSVKDRIAVNHPLSKTCRFIDKSNIELYLQQGWILGSGRFGPKPNKNFWYNNGTKNWRGEKGKQPPGFKPGRILTGNFKGPTTHQKGKMRINNGEINKWIDRTEPIPNGWVKGKIQKEGQ